MICTHASGGCNYPEGECAGLCGKVTALSERIRANSEAAPWVIEEVKRLELELSEAYAELRKQSGHVTAVFDRGVWDRARNA
jgi:hypothetical protein